jgi:hypothetical protein
VYSNSIQLSRAPLVRLTQYVKTFREIAHKNILSSDSLAPFTAAPQSPPWDSRDRSHWRSAAQKQRNELRRNLMT